MRLQDLVDAIVTDPNLRDAMDQLLAIKRAAGRPNEYGRPLPIINAFIDGELTRLESVLPPLPRDTDFCGARSAVDEYRAAHECPRKNLMRRMSSAWRLTGLDLPAQRASTIVKEL